MNASPTRGLVTSIIATAASLAGAVPCETQDLSGIWEVTWAQAVRYEGEQMQIQRWGDAILEIQTVDGQVTGTWTTSITERVTWTLAGTIRDGRLELVATEHDSDNPELAVVEEMRWRARFSEARLEGEMAMIFRGRGGDPRWRPWSATRARGSPYPGL